MRTQGVLRLRVLAVLVAVFACGGPDGERVYDGSWEAASDDSADNFQFVVKGNAITSLWYRFGATVVGPGSLCVATVICPGDHAPCGRRAPAVPIRNDSFEVIDEGSTLSLSIDGTFTSQTTASGSYSATLFSTCGTSRSSSTFTAARVADHSGSSIPTTPGSGGSAGGAGTTPGGGGSAGGAEGETPPWAGDPPDCGPEPGSSTRLFTEDFEQYGQVSNAPLYGLAQSPWIAVESEGRVGVQSRAAHSGSNAVELWQFVDRGTHYAPLELASRPRELVLEVWYQADAFFSEKVYGSVGFGYATSRFDFSEGPSLSAQDRTVFFAPSRGEAATAVYGELEVDPMWNYFKLELEFCGNEARVYGGLDEAAPLRGTYAFDASRAINAVFMAGSRNMTRLDDFVVTVVE